MGEIRASKRNQKEKETENIWDEIEQKWKRRHGYNKANDKINQTWVVEVNPADPDPYADPFKQMITEKRSRVKKQKKQELRNVAEANTKKAKKMGVSTKAIKPTSKQLSNKIDQANRSTASIGKFNERLPGEDTHHRGKRKFAPVTEKAREKGSLSQEKQMSMIIYNQIVGKRDVVNADKAANIQNAIQERGTKKKQKYAKSPKKKQRKGN